MPRRDFALIVLAGGTAATVVICTTVLCALDRLSGTATVGVLTTVVAIGVSAVGRLGPPATGLPEDQGPSRG